MESNDVESIGNVLDDNLDYQKLQFERFIEKNNLHCFGSEYHIIGIIGPQGSGKSTALNEIFGTKFSTKKINEGQKTKGVDTSFDKNNKLLVFDFEGGDSLERGEEKDRYEKTNSLLAYFLSDVILINLWHINISHASCFELCRIIITEALKDKEPGGMDKHIIFLVRDYSKKRDDLIEIKNKIDKGMKKIFDDVTKKGNEQSLQMDKFFKYEFRTFDNGETNEDEFSNQAKNLKDQIISGDFWKVGSCSQNISTLSKHIDVLVELITSKENVKFTEIQRLIHENLCLQAKNEVDIEIDVYITKIMDQVNTKNFNYHKIKILSKSEEIYNVKTSNVSNKIKVDKYRKVLLEGIKKRIGILYLENLNRKVKDKIKHIFDKLKVNKEPWLFFSDEIKSEIFSKIDEFIELEFNELHSDNDFQEVDIDYWKNEAIKYLNNNKDDFIKWLIKITGENNNSYIESEEFHEKVSKGIGYAAGIATVICTAPISAAESAFCTIFSSVGTYLFGKLTGEIFEYYIKETDPKKITLENKIDSKLLKFDVEGITCKLIQKSANKLILKGKISPKWKGMGFKGGLADFVASNAYFLLYKGGSEINKWFDEKKARQLKDSLIENVKKIIQ